MLAVRESAKQAVPSGAAFFLSVPDDATRPGVALAQRGATISYLCHRKCIHIDAPAGLRVVGLFPRPKTKDMKMRFSFAVLLAAILLAPAPADAAGHGRVEVRTGYDDFENVGGFLYGIGAGYDFDLGTSLTLGVEATVEESTADLFILDARRDLGAGIRLGIKTGETGRVYLGAGYSNARVTAPGFGSGNADGIRDSTGY
jgi:outer membrane immunogenic protein